MEETLYRELAPCWHNRGRVSKQNHKGSQKNTQSEPSRKAVFRLDMHTPRRSQKLSKEYVSIFSLKGIYIEPQLPGVLVTKINLPERSGVSKVVG